MWTTDLLQRKRRHYQTCLTSSCIAPSTTRRLMQCPTRHWRRRQRSWHNHIYRLHHRALGWDTFLWNNYLMEGPRTTNYLEGCHNKIKNNVWYAHPNIYEIIDLLQTTQAMRDIAIIQYAAGWAHPSKRPTYRRIDSRLQQRKDRYRHVLVTVTEYADAANQD